MVLFMTPREQFLEEHKKAATTLVQVGLATGFVFDDNTGQGRIHWTPEGDIFRIQLVNTYNKLAKGKGQQGMTELVTLLTFIFKHG
jgi:hypothetical protein